MNDTSKIVNQSFEPTNQTNGLNQRQYFVQEITPYYNLHKPKSSKSTTVLFIVRINGKQIRISTGYKVYPNQWDNGKAKVDKQTPQNIVVLHFY
ncbi:MAG: Arm DNA-binding domain-containing protein [Phocaeicola sp.]